MQESTKDSHDSTPVAEELTPVTDKLKVWMQNLVYPAFLGTYLVAFAQQLPALGATSTANPFWISEWSARNWMGLFAILYYGTLYVETETTPARKYGPGTFVIDFLEVVALSFAFANLTIGQIATFYFAMAVALMLPVIWRGIVEGRKRALLNIACIVGVVLFSVAGLSRLDWIDSKHDTWTMRLAWGILLAYVGYAVLLRPAWTTRATGQACVIPGAYEELPIEPALQTKHFNSRDKFPQGPTGAPTRWQLVKPDSTFRG